MSEEFAEEIGKKYGENLLSIIPQLKPKAAQYFGKGFTDVAMASINTGNLPKKPTDISGGGKRKTNKYYEKLGRIYAEDLVNNEPNLVGSGFFNNVATGFKKAGSWINDHVFKPVGKVASKIVEPIADVASMVLPEFAPEIQLAKTGIKAITKKKGKGKGVSDEMLGQMYGGAIAKEHANISKKAFMKGFNQTWNVKGAGKHLKSKAMSSRGELIKRIMKERGVTLPQASSIIKHEDLKY